MTYDEHIRQKLSKLKMDREVLNKELTDSLDPDEYFKIFLKINNLSYSIKAIQEKLSKRTYKPERHKIKYF